MTYRCARGRTWGLPHPSRQQARLVEDLGDLDLDPSRVAVDDEVPTVVVRHVQYDGAYVAEVAVELVLAAVEIALIVIDIHEADPGSRAAQPYLEAGAACARSEIPIEVLHTLLVADHPEGRKPPKESLRTDLSPTLLVSANSSRVRAGLVPTGRDGQIWITIQLIRISSWHLI